MGGRLEMNPAIHALGRDSARRAEMGFAPVEIDCEKRADGSFLLRSGRELEPHDPNLARLFRRTAERAADKLFLAERDDQRWRTLTYAKARAQADSVAQALIDRG